MDAAFVNSLIESLERSLTTEVVEINRAMAKPSYAAERLRKLRDTIEAETDMFVAEVDAVEKNEVPEAFGQARSYLGLQRADLGELKAELKQLTNLPLSQSGSDENPTSGG